MAQNLKKEAIEKEAIEKEKKEALRPMSRLEFQILYSKCGSSGWVYGEFNETLYQQYLQRYGFFLCHLLYIKDKQKDADGLLTKLNADSDIYFLIDKSRLIHTISLPGTTQFYQNGTSDKNEYNNIEWFFAESPNTLETYVYNTNENKKLSPYYIGPMQIIGHTEDWLEKKIILLDFFPFPIIMSTDIRKDVVEEGYTFRKHLSEYFKPLFENVKKILEPDTEKTQTKVYLISPPYTSIHAIFELTDFEWAELVTLNDGSNYKGQSVTESCGFDEEKTPKKILNGFIEIRKKEYGEFFKKFSIAPPGCPEIAINIPSPEDDYTAFCAYLKKRIYLNNSNNPGNPNNPVIL